MLTSTLEFSLPNLHPILNISYLDPMMEMLDSGVPMLLVERASNLLVNGKSLSMTKPLRRDISICQKFDVYAGTGIFLSR